MSRKFFYTLLFPLILVDSYLLSKPNILGKVGLFVLKFQHLHNFPRALLTVCLTMGAVVVVNELIVWLTQRRIIGRMIGFATLSMFLLASVGILWRIALAFSSWAVGHTGFRFKYGAYLLPMLFAGTFLYGLFILPRKSQPFPESPVMKEINRK